MFAVIILPSFPKMFIMFVVACLQVVHAIMRVTPWARISEEMLRKAIVQLYTDHALVPTGITVEAMRQWSEKMAFGIHKVVRRFRKLYTESPTSSKNVKIQALKERCMKSSVPVCKPLASSDSLCSTPRSASAEDLEKVAPPPIDWGNVLERLRQNKLKSQESGVQSGEGGPEVASKTAALEQRPVATPARAVPKQDTAQNKFLLPQYVVEQLEKKEEYAQPFDTRGTDDGEEIGAIDAELSVPAKKPKKAKRSSRKSKTKKEVFKAEDEAALSEVTGPAAEQASGSTSAGTARSYVPGEFAEARKAFIKAARAEHGIKHKAASDMWMASDLRAGFLSEMGIAEMKKRRFL